MDGDSARMIWKALTGLAGRVRASGRSIIITVARQIGLSDLRGNIFDGVDGPAGGDAVVARGPRCIVNITVEGAGRSNFIYPKRCAACSRYVCR